MNNNYISKNRFEFLMAAVFMLAAVFCSSGCSDGVAVEPVARPDVINIDGMNRLRALERPAVAFPHDMHTDVVMIDDSQNGCGTCHLTEEDGRLSKFFMRYEDYGYDSVMAIYHRECLTCHQTYEPAIAGNAPVVCGECHQNRPALVSSAVPLVFDKSLHARHVAASQNKCDECHHDGEGGLFQDCSSIKGEKTISMRLDGHEDCIACHIRMENKTVTCAGCHDAALQKQIKTLDDIPRLVCNQPDFKFVSAHESELEKSKLNTVPFSHIGHETFVNSCRDCHHKTLRACQDCHTLQGSEEGGGVTLARAMHDINSNHSCVGCHDKLKYGERCAGCHFMMEQGRLSEHACGICHAGPDVANLEATARRVKSLDSFRPKISETRLSFQDKDIPEYVTIGILSDKYEPAVFPHRRIVNTLLEEVGENRMATYFHGHQDVICQGCHHHSPTGKKPPLCENCHGTPFDPADIHKPGLYGAYHRQCIGCHEKINLAGATDDNCTFCHAKKQESGL